MDQETMFGAVIAIVVIFAAWILVREIVCWYYKINDMKENQEKIISLLSSIDHKLTKSESRIPDNREKTNSNGININERYSK